MPRRLRREDGTSATLLPRAGLVANGLMHLLVAWLALQVAFGRNQRADQTGALEAIAAQPLGRVLLWGLTGAFAAVVCWRATEVFGRHPPASSTAQRVGKRLFAAGQVVLYGVLTFLAARVAAGAPGGTGGSGVTVQLLQLPYGSAIVVAAGVAMLVTGGVMVVKGARMSFESDMDMRAVGPRMRTFIERLGQAGAVTKGVAVAVIGGLVVAAGTTYRPEQAEGLDAALKTIAGQPFGPVALVAVAVGLTCYGIFALFDAVLHEV
ncbi:DUF1206 domain-containing protein [Pseudonocardia sp. TRM90224]|uniref:DUF1206 domain-containing protein n=1 Tax=Pseudonocardia sp. TRM90224 TaxID=2812678 RepID=UPI001E3A9A53|nr:DUF1206 domain-containing protein [Pseudonocardia sp. TRM90224]